MGNQESICIRRVSSGATRHAYINCDEEPGHGLILVSLRSLTQYRATLAGMSAFVSGLLKLEPPRSSAAGASFLLGTIRGRHGPRQVSVHIDVGGLMLQVGGEHEPVIRVLRWIGNGLSIDMAHVQRLANRKERTQGSRAAYLPDRTRQLERSRQTQDRNEAIFREAKKRRARTGESWTSVATALAATDLSKTGARRPVSAATVRRIITEMRRRERKNSRSNRKVRK